MRQMFPIVLVSVGVSLTGCVERIVEPTDVWGNIKRGEPYGPTSHMIDEWYAVEAIDAQTFAINEPTSSQYNTSYLLVGETRAIMFDAGSGERPPGSRTMREVAERYAADKPITLILSHYHYDHISDAATFDRTALLDRPEIHSHLTGDRYTITAWESLSLTSVQVNGVTLVGDGDVLDLGNRTLEVLNLPGHANESIVLLERNRNRVFTGDFVYRHLGGIIAFAPGSDLVAYKTNSARLIHLTDTDTQFFGAHGIPRFGRDWLMLLDQELGKMTKGEAQYRYVTHYLAPVLPWRVSRSGELYIYTTPLVEPSRFWSPWTVFLVIAIVFLSLSLFSKMCRLALRICRSTQS